MTGAFFVSSIRHRKIVRIDRSGKITDFVTAGRDGLRPGTGSGRGSLTAVRLLDLGLLVNWQQGNPPPARGIAIGGLGQSLIITGVVLASYGIIARLIKAGRRVDDNPAPAEIGAEIQPAVATITV